MGIYADDGSWNVVVVDGTETTGLLDPSGYVNVFLAPGDAFVGRYHDCGAFNVTVGDGTTNYSSAPDGSLYVQETPYTGNGLKVTVKSGTLSPA